MRVALVLHVFDHVGNVLLRIAFEAPDIKYRTEVIVSFLKICHGDTHDVLPESHISSASLLQFEDCFTGLFTVVLMFLRPLARVRINLFEFRNIKRCFLRVFTRVVRIKIYQVRLSHLKLRDDQSDRGPPVAEVCITDYLMSCIPKYSFYCLTDNRRSHMPHMKRFCNIGSAVVHHNRLRVLCRLQAELRFLLHLTYVIRKKLRSDGKVDKSGGNSLRLRKERILRKNLYNFIGNQNRSFMVLLCGGHGAVALILTQSGTVGNLYGSETVLIPGSEKCRRYLFRDDGNDSFHKHRILSKNETHLNP